MSQPVLSWEATIRWLREQSDLADLVMAGYYDDPLEAAAIRYWQSAEWRAVVARLPVGCVGYALDFGAGRGIASFALAKTGYRVLAVEADASALVGANAIRALARATNTSIEVMESSSPRLPVADDTFDLVFGLAVLHHLPDLESACREFYRVLKPGGTLIMIREHVISKAGDLARFQALHPLHRYYGGEHAYPLDRYVSAIVGAGFSVQEVMRPFGSAINLHPYTDDQLRTEIAQRLGLAGGRLAGAFRVLLANRCVWWLVRRSLDIIDNRPGRLYSFVARRP